MMDDNTVLDTLLKAAGTLALLEQVTVGTDIRGLIYASGLLLGELIDQLEAAAADYDSEEEN